MKQAPHSVPSSSREWRASWWWLGLVLLCLVVYAPALAGDFLWDDNGHVTRRSLQSWEGLFRIWFEVGATQQYYPILHSAFWLEHKLWGDAVVGYHVVNVVLHATAACLFGGLLRRLAVPGAALAMLLFALHPVCVESVAWISEQKNTLSAMFYLLAAHAYLRFDASRQPRAYAWAAGWFVLALLTKTVTATLPAALLVVFWWQRGRLAWRRDVLPLVPWFVAAAIAGLYTAHFERTLIGAEGVDFALGPLDRAVLAGRVVWFYFGKLVWPAGLTFIYPRWTIDAGQGWQWTFLIAALGLLGVLVWLARRRRGPLAAALFYGGTLFPALGFFNVYPFVHSYVADHFQYLASLGVFALAGSGMASLAGRISRFAMLGAASLIGVALGVVSYRQAENYRDQYALYEATLARNPASWLAHHNLAFALAEAGRVQEAIPHLEAVLRLRPNSSLAYNNLGHNLLTLGRAAEALPHLQRAVELTPNYAEAQRNLGFALAQLDRTAEAIAHFERAVQLRPNYADAELQWAIGLMLTGRFDEAVPHFERAIALQPEVAHYHFMFGRALAHVGRVADAVPRLERAVALTPNDAEMHLELALALRRVGRNEEATRHYLEANRLNPALAPTR